MNVESGYKSNGPGPQHAFDQATGMHSVFAGYGYDHSGTYTAMEVEVFTVAATRFGKLSRPSCVTKCMWHGVP